MRSARRHLLALTTAGAVVTGLGATAYATAPAPEAKQPAAEHHPQKPTGKPLAGMRILISNDDGMQAAKPSNSDGLGLYELRRAMCDAGADVVVMAPWQVQSGKGTAVTNGGVLTAQRRTAMPRGYENDCAGALSGAPVFGVCVAEGPCGKDTPSATPADTVKLALRGGLEAKAGWTEAPDVVLTGINSGPNVAASVNDSGTVGAAVAAVDQNVPAVAFSAEGDATNTQYPVRTYRATAGFGARFLAGMRQNDLLTGKFAVKVDYPDTTSGKKVENPVWTRVGNGAAIYHAYKQKSGTASTNGTDSTSFDITMGLCEGKLSSGGECDENRRDADQVWLLEKNHVTIAPITWDRTYGTPIDGTRELRKLENYVRHSAPRA
ncbi:5'/3'-nucleotidase SurE [Streptomyces sp. NBC_00237]|uniref:5'/3'-nucleotidase SurE n=1 Tax=Streptomyces sp. NBC_00237 TaxID=2975687 RepID=UPI00225049E0|nr:5'/3'-nucleotidase SurE [Streptomyces sp. NBC_00237]MCX5204262.1 5'/3'-nucleotidase SurE [Streptomyces sp. NBC_00237]